MLYIKPIDGTAIRFEDNKGHVQTYPIDLIARADTSRKILIVYKYVQKNVLCSCAVSQLSLWDGAKYATHPTAASFVTAFNAMIAGLSPATTTTTTTVFVPGTTTTTSTTTTTVQEVTTTTTTAALVGYFISPTGNDTTGTGTLANPWFTLNKAWTAILPGDTVYLRGGTYAFNSQQYLTGKSGTAGNLIKIYNYPGEVPNLSKSEAYATGNGVYFVGDYFHWKGIEISGYSQIATGVTPGFKVQNSNYNTFEALNVHHNGCGMHITNSGYVLHNTGNLILNCDFHHNSDPLDAYGNGDGLDFGSITHPSDTNTIRGCRFWWNSDDGCDLFDNDGFVTIENCWAYYNGYIPGTFASAGDGMGFKLGDGMTNQSSTHKRDVKNCVSIKNRKHGFTPNGLLGIIKMYNCDAYLNVNIGIHLADSNLYHEVYNCVAYANGTNHGASTNEINVTNSWQHGIAVSDADFASVDLTELTASRQADGSLPVLGLLHLAAGSDLINTGTNVGIPYSGAAPDLGAFEYVPV